MGKFPGRWLEGVSGDRVEKVNHLTDKSLGTLSRERGLARLHITYL